MKKLVLIFVLFTIIVSSVTAGAKPDVYFQTEAFNVFPWRNLAFPGGTTMYGEISHNGFALGIFQYTDLEGKTIGQATNDEMDFLLSYGYDLNNYSLSVILTEYNLPSSPKDAWLHSWEIGMTARCKQWENLTPGVEYYYDFGAYDASYIGTSLTWKYNDNAGIKLTAGINDGQWTEGGKTIKGYDAKIFQEFKFLGNNELSIGVMETDQEHSQRCYMIYKWSL